MNKELFILPFDHRSSFSEEILGTSGKLTIKEKREIINFKEIIFEAFLKSLEKQKKKESFAILVDEEYGKGILKSAKEKNIKICLPVEKSGKEELELEYGSSFDKHIDSFNPDFVKILIRYNPLNKEINGRQLKTLYKINKFCEEKGYKIILELLVPPAKEDLKYKTYDTKERAIRTAEAIKEIKEAINVSIWKLEGFTAIQWKKIIPLVGKGEIIFLGRGQKKEDVEKWLVSAANFKKIIGFAIGRTVFLDPLKKYKSKKMTKEETIEAISQNFNHFISLWQENRIK